MSRLNEPICEMIDLLYADMPNTHLAAFLGIDRQSVTRRGRKLGLVKSVRTARKKPIGTEMAARNPNYIEIKVANGVTASLHVLIWEMHHGTKRPANHGIVFKDGDKSNMSPENLLAMPKAEVFKWARFLQHPLESHVHSLSEQIMALKTSNDIKQTLLDVLDDLVDPEKTPDYVRAAAICEVVQTVVNVVRLEINYLQARKGDGTIPFLEQHEALLAPRKSKDPLLSGPAQDHPWRSTVHRLAP